MFNFQVAAQLSIEHSLLNIFSVFLLIDKCPAFQNPA
jgi:hypothetical protein